MPRRVRTLVLMTFVLAIVGGLPAVAHARVAYSASKPKLSAAPVMGVPFTASGVIRPKATAGSHTVVKIRLFMLMDGHYDVMDTFRAKLSKNAAGKPGTVYSRVITIPMEGEHAVRALYYRGGKLVKKSKVNYFDVQMAAQQITIDPESHADVTAPADTAIDVVFPGTLTGCAADIAFTSAGFVKTSSTPLRYHSDGLAPGRYDWKCSMMNCHYATLVVEAAAGAAGARASAGARGVTYSTSKPALSETPKMNDAFTVSGVIKPKSTQKSRATVKIVLWMKYGDDWGVMDTYKAKLTKRPAGKPGTKYSRSITIPMKGDHGVQAVQYRGGKKVSSSAIKYFTVQP